jgi:tRNA (adenine57-N1/adenine58-N1)-methyltransferase
MISPGSRILLTGEGRTYFVRSGTGTFSTDRGILDLDAVVQASPGDTIVSHTGHAFRILIPRAPDFFEHARRTGAPMLPRDIGLVIAFTGSGISAIFFGGIARKVVTYEAREDFARIAAENIREAGLENVEVIAGDVLSSEGVFDIIHYDMTIGPDHVSHAHALLRPGGYLACYTPFIEHLCGVMDTAEGLFSSVKAVECIEREMTRSKRGTRPSTRVGHSGYLTIARK